MKGITELHGGTVRSESAGKGQGAAFIVRLPLAVAAVLEAPPTVGRRSGGRRVLVVDDNRDAAETLPDIMNPVQIERLIG